MASATASPLARYDAKRDFALTSEPKPVRTRSAATRLAFVIQKHDATRLHYDFRLELDGVLLSWAVPKGPSFDPKDRRLAVHVEDHPVAYGSFEGTIPKGQYGAGTVIVWDRGTWEPLGDAHAGLKAGKLAFRLHGQKLAGTWELVRLNKPGERQEPWLLFKKHDEWARPHTGYDVVTALPDSVVEHPRKPLDAPVGTARTASGAAKARSAPASPAGAQDARGAEPAPAAPTRGARKAAPKAGVRAAADKAAAAIAAAAKSAAGRGAAAAHLAAAEAAPAPIDPVALPGAVRRALPAALAPQLATLSKALPTAGDWIYEIKFDGYRLLARIERGRAKMLTRRGLDWTHKFQGIADELETLGLAAAWLDGEAVVLDAQGRPHFNALQNALDAARNDAVVYYLFDAPFVNGLDLRQVPLHLRRALLRQLVAGHEGSRVRFSEDFAADAAQVLQTACDLELEGVIAKRRDGAYTSERSTDWLKLKCQSRQEFVIAGFSDRSDNPAAVGGLTLAYHGEDGALRYAGRVGTGWSTREAIALRARLAPLVTPRSPFPEGVTRATRWMTRPAATDHWVKPKLVAEVSFSEWTPDGSLRHPSFQGLRVDKPAASVTREEAKAPPKAEARRARGARVGAAASSGPTSMAASAAATATPTARAPAPAHPARAATAKRGVAKTAKPATAPGATPASGAATVAGVRVTHPERVIDASTGLTKLDLARYYESVAEWMLPHLKSRPVALVRAPTGVDGELFFQKHADVRTMPGVKQLEGLWEGHDPLLEIPTAKALVAAAQMNVVEIHTWNSVHQKIDKPDRMILDLDPGEGVKWPQLREAAGLTHTLLQELGLESWLKTSGGKGLHVVVPLAPRLDYDTVKSFSQAVVQHLAKALPQRFVAKSGAANRVGKIFVDYLRNGFNATTAAAFSARARPGLGVSMPVTWDELPELTGGAQWTIATARDRLSLLRADPWAGYWTSRQTLTKAMKTLAG
jgi:bifunctional non-homologous end joining protein LigD